MSKTIWLGVALVSIVAVLMPGCKGSPYYKNVVMVKVVPTFEGPLPDKKEIAKIYYRTQVGLALHIAEIDEKPVEDILKAAQFDTSKYKYSGFYLLPGEHTIRIQGTTRTTSSTPIARYTSASTTTVTARGVSLLTFRAEPGHSYYVDYEKVGKGSDLVRVIIRDDKTKKIVSQ